MIIGNMALICSAFALFLIVFILLFGVEIALVIYAILVSALVVGLLLSIYDELVDINRKLK